MGLRQTLVDNGKPVLLLPAVLRWSRVLANALVLLALKEPEFAVRARAVNVLSGWFPVDVSIGETLRAVAEHDPHQDLRSVAKNALARHS